MTTFIIWASIAAYAAIWIAAARMMFADLTSGPSTRYGAPAGRTKWQDISEGDSLLDVYDYTAISLVVMLFWPIVVPGLLLMDAAAWLFSAPQVRAAKRADSRRDTVARWRRQAVTGTPEERQLAVAVLDALGEQ